MKKARAQLIQSQSTEVGGEKTWWANEEYETQKGILNAAQQNTDS